MKNKLSIYLTYSALIIVVATLFLINPFFGNKYDKAERSVQVFKKNHRPEYDSLVRMYDIQYELINFKHDSMENVINQKFVLLNHTIKMQKLTALISEAEYLRKYNEIWDLELSDHTAIRDSFVQRLMRLDSPKEMKVPRDLSKEVTLYHGIDGLIGFMKWLLLALLTFFFTIDYFKNKSIKDEKSQTIYKEIPKYTVSDDDQGNLIIYEPATLKQTNALKLEIKKDFGDIFTLHAELIPNDDKTKPQMFQLTLVPKQQLNLSKRLYKFFMKGKNLAR